ncbi:MAG: hypothetical protein KA138_05080 [Saprospiraceae bacterium]|nr:hypothetical protein [Saprospiraceae bacterium]
MGELIIISIFTFIVIAIVARLQEALSEVKCLNQLRFLNHVFKLKHDWSDYAFIKHDSCKKQKYCKRCGKIEQADNVSHKWKKLGYIKEDSCEVKFTCERCEATKIEKEHLKWLFGDYLEANSCVQERTCERCKEKSNQINHEEVSVSTYCKAEGKCVRCNQNISIGICSRKTNSGWDNQVEDNFTESYCPLCDDKPTVFFQSEWNKNKGY